ncbi:unnamed protein product [Durusdinium trenchii]|uniref:Exostosin GT47 domain-containing protein n=1 Tax=Durusdinium trenchii TaxID=1381693 RepID=A0ABP0MNK0_9DINO
MGHSFHLRRWQVGGVAFLLRHLWCPSFSGSWTYPLDPRCHNLTLIAATTYMANSDFWHLAPRPGRKAPRPDRLRAPRALCQGLLAAEGPIVAFVEMRYLPEFLDLLGGASTPPFVLVTCGSDAPLTQQLQERLLAVSGFRACYSSNLHVPSYELKEVFHPLPVGFLPGRLNAQNEALLRRAPRASPRDGRLLVPWMRSWRLRRSYWSLLESEPYRPLVVLSDKLNFKDYLLQLSRHRYVLSPPGKGYDCTRTWEALAMGSMPLILRDEDFDQRIYEHAGIRSLPAPEQLTPEILAEILSDEESVQRLDQSQLYVKHWTNLWRQHLS